MSDLTVTQPAKKVITVRCSKELHWWLSEEAWRRRRSMNQLVIDLVEQERDRSQEACVPGGKGP